MGHPVILLQDPYHHTQLELLWNALHTRGREREGGRRKGVRERGREGGSERGREGGREGGRE